MSEKQKIYIFIRNVDEYLRGEFEWCFSASTYEKHGGEPGDELYYPLLTSVEFNPSMVDIAELTKIALNAIDEQIKKVRVESEVKLEMLNTKKSTLLFLTPGKTGEEK